MKINDILKSRERTYSFEFFPPKDEISAVDFGINVGQLIKLNPSFVTVTYGAGGSNREKNFALVDYLQNRIGLTTMAHYTSIGTTSSKILEDMNSLAGIGIENLMLLRGDKPKGPDNFETPADGFRYASELISFVREKFKFSIGAAAYPEKHPEAGTFEEDMVNLKKKCNAGVDFLITQLFFDNDTYFRFVEVARQNGIMCRIIPGIIPITNYSQINRFIRMTGAKFPAVLLDRLMSYEHEPDKVYQTGVDYAIKQCLDLLKRGAPGLHFYTLNKSRAAVEVFESLPV
jgi:methylenetetrahydrofolate reductase (NADPH)